MTAAFESLYINKENAVGYQAQAQEYDQYRIKAKEYFRRSRSPYKVPKISSRAAKAEVKDKESSYRTPVSKPATIGKEP